MASEIDRETLLLKREILAAKMAEQQCFAKKNQACSWFRLTGGAHTLGGKDWA